MGSGNELGLGKPGRLGVVLGGGGVIGAAWMAGVGAGLRRRGIDLGAAESVVGTSAAGGGPPAGRRGGAALATGVDLDSFAEHRGRPGGDAGGAVKPELLGAVFGLLFGSGMDREAARRKVGQLAMAEEAAGARHFEAMEWLVGGKEWPDRLRVVVVDAESGERRVWDRHSGVPLPVAVTASRALPGAFPPVVVDDHYYIDGGVWSPTNADVAADSDILVVIEPLAHRVSGEQLQDELARTTAGTVVRFAPDAAAIDVFNAYAANTLAGWPEAFGHGVRQADSLARKLAVTVD
ncbi:patatin-like phospholipase family protein [Nocardia sp. CDC160]|uniref:patatin-like phospholipase family protein n=1 Tax=Nocardia sp. CDC160 TaxID=3112166 RepID=UPI002DB66D83|nr:patatin-like phospholipase family protein [Nocardia sp. CDC160]MEC3917809.1 patatin-like phospholipase family protein [Nocardia sp. CDC160]